MMSARDCLWDAGAVVAGEMTGENVGIVVELGNGEDENGELNPGIVVNTDGGDGMSTHSLLVVTMVMFDTSNLVSASDAMYFIVSVVARSLGRPTTVMSPLAVAVSTRAVMAKSGSCVARLTFTMAVEAVDVRM